jgi:short-subunit dehydrogenase
MPLPTPGPGRTAIVTGASGGIGEEIARDLSRRGHHVTLVARSADKLQALAGELVNADVIAMDLADRAGRAALLDLLDERGRVPDILVNNAGLSTMGAVSQSDPAAELNMIEVDVVAVADLCSRILPGMVQRGRGAVLNVASTAAFQPLPGQAGYGAAKAFVLSYTQSLAGELRGTGVTATTLCPGPVHTGFGERAGFSREDAEAALPAVMWVTAEEVAKSAVEGMAKGRLVVIPGTVNRIAAALSQVTPRSLLLPILVKSHPGLR